MIKFLIFSSHYFSWSMITGIQAVSQLQKNIICRSGFISESNSFNNLATLKIPKQVRDDNCDTV